MDFMKGILYVVCLGLLVSCSSDSPNMEELPDIDGMDGVEITVQASVFGGSLNDNANAVIATADGGYALLGHTQSLDGDVTDKNNDSFDFWMLKFNESHELQWSQTYGGLDDDRGSDLLQTCDGGYMILGYSTSTDGDVMANAGGQDHWMARTDASGTILWQKSFGFSGRDEGISIIETSDTGFLILGLLDVTASEGQGSSLTMHAGGNYWALKVDQNGELQWRHFYGGSFTDTPQAVVEDNEGNFIIVGASDSDDVDITDNKGGYDMWVLKVAATGELLWQKSFGGSEIDGGHDIVQATDGNYLLVGDTRSTDVDISSNNGAADLWIVKIDGEGELIWERTYGGSGFDAGRAIKRDPQGGYLITGSSRSLDGDVATNKGQNDLWVLRIDEAGGLLWQQTIGGSEIDFGYDLAILNDGTVVVVGESGSADGDIPKNQGFTDILKIIIP